MSSEIYFILLFANFFASDAIFTSFRHALMQIHLYPLCFEPVSPQTEREELNAVASAKFKNVEKAETFDFFFAIYIFVCCGCCKQKRNVDKQKLVCLREYVLTAILCIFEKLHH